MSKLSFRARALDATKAMSIFRKDGVADLPDYSVLNRAVPQMPTGMEKEEESEHHLQRAISAQQVYGDRKVMVIPVPEAEVGVDYYNNVYKKQFRVPKQYIHNQAQALNSIMEQEKPDYDMDSDDEQWVRDTNKRTGLEITHIQFEEMIDRLEKSCGNQVVSLQEAKLLLKEDDDLIKAVYEYWLQQRAKSSSGLLTFQVRQEKRDGSSSGDSYVAFRRRTEKMQTRKNRKNDEASYEKMLKLRRDLTRAVTILEMVKRREKCKWELLHLTLEITEKRYQMKDWAGKSLKMAKREIAIGQGKLAAITVGRAKHVSGGKTTTGTNAATVAKQRIKAKIEREKRRKSNKDKSKIRLGHASAIPNLSSTNATSSSALPGSSAVRHPTHKHTPVVGATSKSPSYSSTFTYEQAVDTMRQYEFHSSDEEMARPKSPVSGSVASTDERKKNPDGIFALKPKLGCKYEAPHDDLRGDHWSWTTDDRHRYSLTTLSAPEKCAGFCRRRVGRGGRMLIDRAYTPLKQQLSEIDLHPETHNLPHSQSLQQLMEEIKRGRWRRYRPYSPSSHKAHELLRSNNSRETTLKPFGHSSTAAEKHSFNPKETKPRTDSSGSETIDIVTAEENFREDLVRKRLLQKSLHTKPLQKNKTAHKRMLVHGRHLDKPSALFAVSALVTSGSSPLRTKVKTGRSHQFKLNVVSGTAATALNSTSSRSAPMGKAFFGNNPGVSPGRYNISNLVASPSSMKSSPTSKKGKQQIGRLTLDQAKVLGVKGQEKVHATLIPVGSRLKSSSGTSVTLTVTGPAPKVSLTATAATSHTATTVNGTSLAETVLTNSYSISSAPAETSSTPGTVFITPTTRIQQSKISLGKLHMSGSVPLTLTNVNSTTLLPSQYKNAQQSVLLGSQSLKLALTPATPQQKHASLSQLSIPNSSGHASAILIAAPGSGTLASSLPSSGNTGLDGASSCGATLNLKQAKTVSINVARVQAPSSGLGQIFTLHQHPGSSIGTLTVSGSQTQGAKPSGPTWVASGSGPNILKLGSTGVPSGVQVHPVTASFKMGVANKPLAVISKRPHGQPSNAARTINIANSKQVSANSLKIAGVPSQITLVPDNRADLTGKPLISITHSQKKNSAATVLLSTKSLPVIEQSCVASTATSQSTSPNVLATDLGSIVTDAPALSGKRSKNNQPMEVT